MSTQTQLSRYSLIIERLTKSPATFADIQDYLKSKGYFDNADLERSKRTFQREIHQILKEFHHEITYNKKTKCYEIELNNMEATAGQRLMEAHQTINLLNHQQDYSAFIFFEKRKPLGLEHFHGILHAIANRLLINIEYQKFSDSIISKRTLKPLALKEFKSRWYIIAIDSKDEAIKTFALDRIKDITITKIRFTISKQINIDALFDKYFGIINPQNSKAEKVTLSCEHEHGQYVKTYPLHHSQRIISETADEVVIQLEVAITYDFIMELLSYGAEVEVTEPLSLIEQLKNIYTSALGFYK